MEVIVDIFDGLGLKIGGFLLFLAQFPSFLIILAFVLWEIQGLAGPCRTIINQLTARLYFIVSIFQPTVH